MHVSWSRILSVILLILIFGWIYSYHIGPSQFRKIALHSVVQKVRDDVGGFPYITIDGKQYSMYYAYGHYQNIRIHPGDTLIKQAGDLQVKIRRPATIDTVYYNSGHN